MQVLREGVVEEAVLVLRLHIIYRVAIDRESIVEGQLIQRTLHVRPETVAIVMESCASLGIELVEDIEQVLNAEIDITLVGDGHLEERDAGEGTLVDQLLEQISAATSETGVDHSVLGGIDQLVLPREGLPELQDLLHGAIEVTKEEVALQTIVVEEDVAPLATLVLAGEPVEVLIPLLRGELKVRGGVLQSPAFALTDRRLGPYRTRLEEIGLVLLLLSPTDLLIALLIVADLRQLLIVGDPDERLSDRLTHRLRQVDILGVILCQGPLRDHRVQLTEVERAPLVALLIVNHLCCAQYIL